MQNIEYGLIISVHAMDLADQNIVLAVKRETDGPVTGTPDLRSFGHVGSDPDFAPEHGLVVLTFVLPDFSKHPEPESLEFLDLPSFEDVAPKHTNPHYLALACQHASSWDGFDDAVAEIVRFNGHDGR